MTLGNETGRGSRHSEGGEASRVVAALDIGSTKISCMIAERVARDTSATVDPRRTLRAIGIGQTASRGIRGGAISSIDDVERAIRVAVDTAERSAGRRIRDVVVNVSGGKPSSVTVQGFVQTQTGIVSPRDVENGISAAIGNAEIGRRHVLHLNPVGFSLDGVAADKAPLGMHGEVLGADLGIVTLEPAHLRNLTLAVERAHLKVAQVVLSAYAAGRGTLLADEMSMGTLVIDMGGATTGYALFRNGNLAMSGIVPIGSAHITSDVAAGLSTTMAHAERMKTMFGSVLPFASEDREMVAVPLLGERGVDSVQQVPKHVLTSIIRPRLEEIFEQVQTRLSQSAAASAISRLVITGGGSQLQGIRDFASYFFDCPVRLGQPVLPQGVPESARGNGLAVTAGLMVLALRPDRKLAMPSAAQHKIEQAQMGYARRVGRWLKEAL